MSRQSMFPSILVAIILSVPLFVNAQKKDSTFIGSISGSVKDTAQNYFLQSATVSVYTEKDNKLFFFTLTNSLGEFHIGSLPLNLKLYLRVTYIGYDTYSKSIFLGFEKKSVDLGEIDLRRTSNTLENVTVTPPPVRMHGDTLEFSAAAFEMDKNAVAEDLLKKLPGVIVWGDGAITVNGKQISKLLVDGKPFLGGDAVVATQNLPKDAIDKVQVYQENINSLDPYDSTTAINLKLRKKYHSGYLGAISAGASSPEGKYDVEANNSIFTPKNQIAIVAQSNNVNKTANDINTLLRNNTFKGVNARIEYQPDFSLPGINQQSSGGVLFTHDFIPEFNQYKENRLSANSFFNHNFNNTINQTQTITAIGIDSTLAQNSFNTTRTDGNEVHFDSHYKKLKNQDSLMVEGFYDYKMNDIQKLLTNEVHSSALGLLSNANQTDTNRTTSNKIGFYGAYNHQGFYNSATRKLTNWSFNYSISYQTENFSRALRTEFLNIYDTTMNQYYDRKYNNHKDIVAQDLRMNVGNFATWLFGKSRVLSRLQIELSNELQWDNERQHNVIQDGDTLNKLYSVNEGLSKIGDFKALTETPDLRIGRSFINVLANRYQKEFSIWVDSKFQFNYQGNFSTRSFQNYIANYFRFVPNINLAYSDFQYGEYLNSFDLNLEKSAYYPTPDQRFPLVDSSAIYAIHEGNAFLTPQNKYEVAFNFHHRNLHSKNTLLYGFNITDGFIKNYFGDSTNVDFAGRYFNYTINLNGNRYLKMHIFLNKAFIHGQHQFQVNISSAVEKNRNPGYIGYQSTNQFGFNVSNIFINADSLSLFYTYKDFLALHFFQNIYYYRSRQNGFSNIELGSLQSLTRFGAALNITKRFSITSNVSFNWYSYSNGPANKFTIWNAFLSYRFLRASNLELKLSAMDILNQNKGIINSGSNYSFTHGTVNLLHQYFMATLSYFPRKFGNNKAAK
ncbi:MAG: hypothetical protein JST58_04910 [Bacteroidetes bacterium]|nr:hypothetical protein [Bacteroidota bacterium]